MGIRIPKLADGEEFVAGRSQATAKELVLKAEAAGLKGTVKTTYNGYIVPSAIFAGETPEDAIVAGDVVDDADEDQDTATDTDADKAEEVEGTEEEAVNAFDPSAATVDEVKDYLDGADDTERERVLAAEAEGKGRKSVLGLATIPEGAK